jgi:hypothetical protein
MCYKHRDWRQARIGGNYFLYDRRGPGKFSLFPRLSREGCPGLTRPADNTAPHGIAAALKETLDPAEILIRKTLQAGRDKYDFNHRGQC